MKKTIIGLASDHAGFAMKQYIKTLLADKGLEYIDYGTDSEESCDYPDYAHALARGIEKGEVEIGIGLCGSGEGMAITLNKHPQIRAGLVWNNDVARLIRQHNNANVLVLPARFINDEQASQFIDTFLETPFEGGRHERRVNKIQIQ